jgi:hypothetical protein
VVDGIPRGNHRGKEGGGGYESEGRRMSIMSQILKFLNFFEDDRCYINTEEIS